MSRSKGSVASRAKKKKVLEAAKGGFLGRRKLYRVARENVLRAMQFAYRDRRQRKRHMRRLWIQRINAAARHHGMSYNQLIDGLKKAEVTIDRKMLSDLAVHDLDAFGQIVDTARKHVQ